MADAWLDIELGGGTRRRQELKRGLTMIGGEKSDVPLAAAGADRLHLWDAPPKLIFVGAGARPKVNGAASDECELRSGDVIEWYGARLTFGAETRAAASAPPPARVAAPVATIPPPQVSGMPSRDEQMWRRLRAGLLVELGLGEAQATRRWQEAARRNEFEPDACARDVLGSSTSAEADERLLERTSAMLKEMLLAPLAARRAEKRKKPKQLGCFSMLVGQLLVFVVYGTVVAVVLFAVRQRWGWSIDGFLDQVIKRFT